MLLKLLLQIKNLNKLKPVTILFFTSLGLIIKTLMILHSVFICKPCNKQYANHIEIKEGVFQNEI